MFIQNKIVHLKIKYHIKASNLLVVKQRLLYWVLEVNIGLKTHNKG